MTAIRLASTIAFATLVASPTAGFAFTGDNHKELTAAAFRVLADPQTVAELREASLIGDSSAYEPLAPGKPWFLSAAHFDNCAWAEGSTWIKDHRKAAVAAAIAYDASPTVTRRAVVFGNLGFVLHATEDFYAHSYWVESHSWGSLANLDGAEPAGWFSGTYPDDLPKNCPAGFPGHDLLNKDSASRTGFDEAYADAILAVQDQLDRFVAELRADAPARADAILARLGLRPQARVISAGLADGQGLLLSRHHVLALRSRDRSRRPRLSARHRIELARPRRRHRRGTGRARRSQGVLLSRLELRAL
jgi:hypothetical protein